MLYHLFQENKSSWIEYYIIKFYKYLGVNVLDIAYFNDGSKDRYITKTPVNPNTNPDIIILFHQKLNKITKDYIKYFSSIKNKKNTSHLAINYIVPPEKVDGITEYKNEITYNGVTYILSSCLSNENELGYEYHSVAGIICNDTKYVYNGYKQKTNNSCGIIKYNWDINKNEDYCLNPNECKINMTNTITKIKDLCFNFGKGERILIFVKKQEYTIPNHSKNFKRKGITKEVIKALIDEIDKDSNGKISKEEFV